MDHIPLDIIKNPVDILRLLNLDKLDLHQSEMYFGAGLESRKLGKKMFIKLVNRECDDTFFNRLALISDVTVNVIKGYEVVQKYKLQFPEKVDFVPCINAGCITNREKCLPYWELEDKEKGLYRCHYCERTADKSRLISELINKRNKDIYKQFTK